MNSRLLMVLSLCGAMGLAISVSAADDAGKPATQPTSQPVVRISVGREMSAMSRAYKFIRLQVADPTKNASTIAAVQNLEQHTILAKSAIPRTATTLPTDAENAQKRSAYESEMITLLRQELDLEEQLLANQNDKAAKTVDALHSLEEEGHKDFRTRRAN